MITEIMPAKGEMPQTSDQLIFDSKAQVKLRKLKSLPPEILAGEVGKLLSRMNLAEGRIAKANNAKVKAACASGFYIEAAKRQLAYGEYLIWLKTCGLGISEDTAERHRKLAALSAHVRNLPPGTTLNQAYLSLGITKQPAPLTPAEQLRRKLQVIKQQMRNLASKVSLSDRSCLATEIRAHISKCEKAAQRLEASVLRERLLNDALEEWGGTYILLGL